MIYRIEKHTTIEWVVTGRQEGDNLRNVIAKCPAEGIALTIKGMYEKEEQRDLEQDTSLEGLCKQLAKQLTAVTWLLHRRALDPQEVEILVKADDMLETAKKKGVIEP